MHVTSLGVDVAAASFMIIAEFRAIVLTAVFQPAVVILVWTILSMV